MSAPRCGPQKAKEKWRTRIENTVLLKRKYMLSPIYPSSDLVRKSFGDEVTGMRLAKAVDWGNLGYWACWMPAIGCLIYLGAVALGSFIAG